MNRFKDLADNCPGCDLSVIPHKMTYLNGSDDLSDYFLSYKCGFCKREWTRMAEGPNVKVDILRIGRYP